MAQYLDIVGSQVPFNFSAAQVISSWMVHALPQDAAELMHIAGPIHALHENLALLSGHGMTELWSALVTLIDDRAVYERFSKYEHVVLPSGSSLSLIRYQVLTPFQIRECISFRLLLFLHYHRPLSDSIPKASIAYSNKWIR
jgi:hypothetical protein